LASPRIVSWGSLAQPSPAQPLSASGVIQRVKLPRVAKTRLIIRPVRYSELHLADVMAAGGVMFVRNGRPVMLFLIPIT
jgi:hypothetical protein